MPLHTIRITTLIGSVLVSATALAAPKPFDLNLVGPGALPIDEDVVVRYVANCTPTATAPLRVCVESPLDIDGQPGVDMIVGVNHTVQKRFYPGRNNGLFGAPTPFGVNGPTSGLKLADLDNDGDLDMIETIRANGSLVATNTLYVNAAGTLQSLLAGAQPLDAAKHDRSSSVVIGDVNNDGRLDVIVTNETEGTQNNPAGSWLPYGQTNYLYLNTQATTANNIVFGPAIALDAANEERYTRRGLLIDVEGDGDLDLVVTSADNHLDNEGNGNWLYVNRTVGGTPAPLPGANPFAPAIPLAGAADDTDVANAIAAGDIDGDGDPDLVFSTWSRMDGAAAVPASNRYYINSSTPGFINFETTGTFGPSANHTNIRLGDFDNDNDLDVLALVHVPAARSRLHLNTNTPGAFFDNTGLELVPPAQWTLDRPRGLDTADLNNDGSLDLVIVNREQVGLRYLNNDQCSASGCGAFAGPFANHAPSIPAPISTVTAPAGTAPIDVDTLLGTLVVTDPDNVYPTDFTAVVLQPVATADYTCSQGAVASGPDSVCIDGLITPAAGAETNGSIGPVEVKVSDGVATSAAARVDVLIQGASPNAAPTITAPGPRTATVGQAFSLPVTATDANMDALTITATGLPTELSLSGGVISGTVTSTTGSPFTVTLTADDGRGLTDSETFQLTVVNAPTTGGGGTGGGGTPSGSSGGGSSGGGSLGFLDLLWLLGAGALAARRRRRENVSFMPRGH
jgi:hypothetical protein